MRLFAADRVGHTFVVCGILYVINDAYKMHSRVRYAYDLRTAKRTKVSAAQAASQTHDTHTQVNLKLTNPRGLTSSVSYNPNDHQLYVYNKATLLSLPLTIRY